MTKKNRNSSRYRKQSKKARIKRHQPTLLFSDRGGGKPVPLDYLVNPKRKISRGNR